MMAGLRTLDRNRLTGIEGGPSDAERTVVLVHGFPQSSHMWRPIAGELADRGFRVIAPDLYCLGQSTDPGPATFERNRDIVGELLDSLDTPRLDLVLHDWGGFVTLAWASTHPERVRSMVISDTGFFSDGRWHGMATAIRQPGGEALLEGLGREAFAAILRDDGAEFSEEDIDAYWHPFAHGRGRQATVEFYRSMDFEKLAPYEARLGDVTAPTLLLWGADDPFAPPSGAHRFARMLDNAELVLLEGVGHFAFDGAPEEARARVVEFLTSEAA
jgi:haloalkane dehalogenase